MAAARAPQDEPLLAAGADEEEEEEVFAADDGGGEEAEFDEAIGALEGVMVDPGFGAALAAFRAGARERAAADGDDAAGGLEEAAVAEMHAEYRALLEEWLAPALEAAAPSIGGLGSLAEAAAGRPGEASPELLDLLATAACPGAFAEVLSAWLAGEGGSPARCGARAAAKTSPVRPAAVGGAWRLFGR